jgi:hypothetical protein
MVLGAFAKRGWAVIFFAKELLIALINAPVRHIETNRKGCGLKAKDSALYPRFEKLGVYGTAL